MTAPQTIHYKRSRFATRLPVDRLYTAGHVWLWAQADDRWRIGFTKFALRMLGDPVEIEFEAKEGSEVDAGQVIGWMEGFKAVSDVFAPLAGIFEGSNPDLATDINIVKHASYDRGWLFQMHGQPDEACLDAPGYVAVLDATIDKMLGGQS